MAKRFVEGEGRVATAVITRERGSSNQCLLISADLYRNELSSSR